MYRVYKFILPEVRSALAKWRARAELIPNEELRKQALASIATKQFHCEGGAVYASVRLDKRDVLIPLIVAFQTISDYLDNLCDRSTSLDADDFRLLHQSMLDAVQPELPMRDYYALREDKDDGDYLRALVQTCRDCIQQLPGYASAQSEIVNLVSLYSDLQVHKHIRKERREPALLAWWEQHAADFPDIGWNEFAAATGSTLGVFQLFLSACDERLTVAETLAIKHAYFPYVCGLHILLDYLIDQEEDRAGGDLNFCNYYDGEATVIQRIGRFADEAIARVSSLPNGRFHRMIIEGLLALYLSDPKVSEQGEVRNVSKRLMKNSPLMRLFFWLNSRWIRKHMY
ncbi:tetraprenyl-beta-curcumene synthase family protein [Paenibacillus sp. 481]|uniref:tetraprenyl-beta-curcumene synthase family protein n=1 Tax=Paenibacillus sp. 481 TaxID=2835869 RepID=UPI001E33E36C|nr:tetraprenyl-beta-curcumene synthase family protein [Paenibacillus sp. 481]UHA76168.1 tetraprenyl-beta-curcumene synthase family protein [Paenibacillus sp. 481]